MCACHKLANIEGFNILEKLHLQFITDKHISKQQLTAQSELGVGIDRGPGPGWGCHFLPRTGPGRGVIKIGRGCISNLSTIYSAV